jgi:hypothetical protein
MIPTRPAATPAMIQRTPTVVSTGMVWPPCLSSQKENLAAVSKARLA